jgi:hypothetical protein
MSADSSETPHSLPRRPNLRQLKDQAKDLLKSGQAASLGDAQFQIARLYGFPQLAQTQSSSRMAGRSLGGVRYQGR